MNKLSVGEWVANLLLEEGDAKSFEDRPEIEDDKVEGDCLPEHEMPPDLLGSHIVVSVKKSWAQVEVVKSFHFCHQVLQVDFWLVQVLNSDSLLLSPKIEMNVEFYHSGIKLA